MLRLGWSEAGEPPCPRGAEHGTEPPLPLPHQCGATGETLPLARSLFQFPQELRDSPQPVGARQQGDSPVPHPAVTLEALTASPSSVQPSEHKGRTEPSPRSFSSSQSADNSVLSRLFNISYKAHTHTQPGVSLSNFDLSFSIFKLRLCQPGIRARGPGARSCGAWELPRAWASPWLRLPSACCTEGSGAASWGGFGAGRLLVPAPGLDAAGTAEGLASKWLPA